MLKTDFILTEEEPIGFQQGTLPDYHIFTCEHFLAENLHYLQPKLLQGNVIVKQITSKLLYLLN